MTQDWTLPVWLVLAVLAAVVLLVLAGVVLLARSRSRSRRELGLAAAESAELRERIDQLDQVTRALQQQPVRVTEQEYVITRLGADEEQPAVPTVAPRLFTDIVARETVVKSVALAHGVRRALSPETRNRIRFEMKREVKRARKQRRADLKVARREWEARQRAGLDHQGSDREAEAS